MRRIRLTPKALADLAEIRRYTRRAWGPAQARSYLNALNDRFKSIADGAALSVTVNAEGRAFRRCRFEEHLIFFEESSEAVVIVRVLHPRMNIAARLRER